mgnify:CR=1 FL=1
MPKRTDIKKVMVIGSGPIVIGQAAEFDYAGTQACLALKEEGYEVVLVNSNPATIQTDVQIADKVYMEPLTLEYVAKIVRYERPDAIVPGLGGQTGLNLAVQLAKKGVLQECQVEILGTSFQSIEQAEDRELFKELCQSLGEPVLPSLIANNIDEAVEAAKRIGYPVVLRPAFTLGGTGGGFADNREELEELQAEQMRCYATAALLLHSGQIDPDEKNSAGRRAFDLAMEGGAKWVGALLSGEDPFDELTMETGGMDLFQALRQRDRKALEALLQAGVDLNAECDNREMNDWTGKTPLVCALEWGETEIAAMLLRAGADPDRRTAKGMSPFAVWIEQGCRISDGMERFAPVMELFEERGWHPDAPQTGKDERALMLACQHDDYELAIWTLRRLLKQKVEVNARDALGRTALMHLLGPHSAGPYQPEMLERLLEVGADPCTADNEGRTVLHYAAEGYTHAAARQAAELLLDFGRPDVSAVDNEGRTPLDIAMRSNNESLVKFLLKHV